MKKLVLKVDVHDDKEKSKAMQAVSGLGLLALSVSLSHNNFSGIGSLTMDMEDKKLTVSGDFDPVQVVNKLRKSWRTEIVSVGPAKEDEGKKNENTVKAYQAYHYSLPLTYSYYVPDHEETRNCVIC